MSIPDTSLVSLLQPVAGMLRNSLISVGPKLRELDFTHLQMYIPALHETELLIAATVHVKTSSTARYRLNSRQTFNFTRIDANDALNALGLTAREVTKADYPKLKAALESVGHFTTVSGDPEQGDDIAVLAFRFGEPVTQSLLPATFVDLGSDVKTKAHYGIPFKGTVRFVLTEISQPAEPTPPSDTPSDTKPKIDISRLLLNTDLGSVTEYPVV